MNHDTHVTIKCDAIIIPNKTMKLYSTEVNKNEIFFEIVIGNILN